MAHGWAGADPTQSSDGASYELGTEYLVAGQTVTVTAVRVWAGAAGSGSVSNRAGRLWTTTGSLLGTAAMATTLPSGWTEYTLASPVVRTAGSRMVVSYTTGGNYGELVHGLDSDVVSSDGAVTALGFSTATNGDGVFNTSTTQFPTSSGSTHTFYGIDIVYTVGAGGPTITGMSAVAAGAVVTATINATDPGGLGGATYRFDWGDGTTTAGSSNTAMYTYTVSGDYAVLGSVTDAGGLSAYAARAVDVDIPLAGVVGVQSGPIIQAVISVASATGRFDRFAGHEPASPPGNGLSGSVWVAGIDALAQQSGLATVTVLLTLNVRLYTNMKPGADPADRDLIDPNLTDAVDATMASLANAYTLGGLIQEVDLLGGMSGTRLAARYGYINIGGTLYRACTITVPCVVADVWQEIP